MAADVRKIVHLCVSVVSLNRLGFDEDDGPETSKMRQCRWKEDAAESMCSQTAFPLCPVPI